MSTQQRALVTYSASGSFLESEQWKQLRASLLSQLPLRNLHWRSAHRPLHTIQELPIELVALDSVRYEAVSQVPLTVLEKPLVNIYITTCEDAETYRLSVKRHMKDWHNTVTQRRNQEWLILHLVGQDVRASRAGFLQMRSTVLDKIKADFNVDRRDRCVQLAWTPAQDNPAAWAEIINKIKDGVLSAFDSAISLREEEVKRSENQRQMPGWNFCTFFILKESLASSFEDVNLCEEALLQYDELEALFTQVLKDKNLTWFGSFANPGPKDDSAPLLSITKKPYRDLILANTISVFDFRVYLLARQCLVLAKLGRVIEIARKATSFLSSFGRRLREMNDGIPEPFVESWTYSSALSVVSQSEQWASAFELDSATILSFNAAKGDLTNLARNQLDIIGVKAGYLPHKPPFSISLTENPAVPKTNGVNGTHKRSTSKISNADLVLALKDKETFYDLYNRITKRAIDFFAKAGRRKSALKLHGSLAALDVHRGQLTTALTTFSSLPAHYGPNKWTSLESYVLSQALDTHQQLEKPKDQDWMHMLLNFLSAYVQDIEGALLMQVEDKNEYLKRLMSAMSSSASAMEADMEIPDHSMLSVKVSTNQAKLVSSEDRCSLEITVENSLPCAIPADQILVNLTGQDADALVFQEDVNDIPSGTSTFSLSCPTSSHGTYVLHASEIRISRLHLRWKHWDAASVWKKSKTKKDRPCLVHIPQDPASFSIRLEQPRRIELGAPSTIHVVISSGRNDVHSANLQISLPPGIRCMHDRSTIDADDESVQLRVEESHIILSDIRAGATVHLTVPHSDASSFPAVKVGVKAAYRTVSQADVERTLHLSNILNTTLLVAANVQDFFRGSRLFSKFIISTTSQQVVRLRSVDLELAEGPQSSVRITACKSGHRTVTSIAPARPGNFVFRIESDDGPVRQPLQLRITYQTLQEELDALIRRAMDQAVQSSPSYAPLRQVAMDQLLAEIQAIGSWMDIYNATGRLSLHKDVDGDTPLAQLVAQVKMRLRADASVPGPWRELVISMDVPQMSINAAACLRLSPMPLTSDSKKSRSLHAGQPIPALISVKTSLHWGRNSTVDGYMLRFDVEEMVRDWLVSGPKRGDFMAKDGETFSLPITLVALHHGELSLPRISVTPLPLAGSLTMGGSMAIPSIDTYQVHGAERVLILPRGGRSTFVVGMGHDYQQ
ncbi:hypothetical protein PUNSTDRAFT_144927 [Punctularia strigosozonata HHB-11173 SS5]|uniref:uncharacterized protein n=1 Tax=Punctularia strigosozonata (strain HHB-11173) TaxID=741275 RepID=UPI0004417B6D|nr:uncharacterized protein PUNSTDRAFT_144927 [Punctularia strigosozonata HHB-11173 SS5]EIN07448.1 hypothetical protein PUNSTDRAFT_144927 [Punctularia strigosozonata HHB-11173 SS5]